jgi:hypothetical protein
MITSQHEKKNEKKKDKKGQWRKDIQVTCSVMKKGWWSLQWLHHFTIKTSKMKLLWRERPFCS